MVCYSFNRFLFNTVTAGDINKAATTEPGHAFPDCVC